MKKFANEPHMRAVQDFRKSSSSGFHGGTMKQKNKKERKQTKQIVKQYVDGLVYLRKVS